MTWNPCSQLPNIMPGLGGLSRSPRSRYEVSYVSSPVIDLPAPWTPCTRSQTHVSSHFLLKVLVGVAVSAIPRDATPACPVTHCPGLPMWARHSTCRYVCCWSCSPMLHFSAAAMSDPARLT